MKTITFTVTNDLVYDQRMQRICTSLAGTHDVLLIGRKLNDSKPLPAQPFRQKRLKCFFAAGKMFYVEYNLRLFFFLLFIKADCFCVIDLDTILPNYFASFLRSKKRVYDAHELFTEQKEIVTRPVIRKLWLAIERFAVPRFINGYTVNDFIADELKSRYGVHYSIVRNLPWLTKQSGVTDHSQPFIIYQGAVNEGRSFETLIPAMRQVNAKLIICGSGNFFENVKQLITENDVGDKVELRGLVSPSELRQLTPLASVAVMLFENTGLNQYQSLANRFFDYMMAGVPQVCVSYPQYKAINEQYNIALLIDDTKPETIAAALNRLLTDNTFHAQLQSNSLAASEYLNWQSEEKVLIDFYHKLLL